MVTGSHTPPPTTGLLFFLADTGEMDERTEHRFEELFSSGVIHRQPWNQLGRISTQNILDTYAEEIQRNRAVGISCRG